MRCDLPCVHLARYKLTLYSFTLHGFTVGMHFHTDVNAEITVKVVADEETIM